MRGIGIAVLVLTVAGCGGEPGRTLHAGNVTVVDQSGLVRSVERPPPPAIETLTEPTVTKGDSLTQVLLAWKGSSCVEGWTVRLGGNALTLSIEPTSVPSDCYGTFAANAVQLDLNRAVDAADIDVRLVDGS